MKTRIVSFAVGIITVVAAASSFSQVIIRGTETSDQSGANSSSSSAVTVNTGDRNIVPLIKDTKDTKINANTQESESVTRARTADGGYFDWQRSATVTKEVAPGQSISSKDVVEQDHEGGTHASGHSDSMVDKTTSGEIDHTAVYKPDSSGRLELDHVVDATTVKQGAGVADTTSSESVADINGNLSLQKQVDSVTLKRGANEQVTAAETRTTDHMDGQIAVTGQEITSVNSQGATKQTDSVVRAPGGIGWEETSHTTTTVTKAPDGSITRETVVAGRPAYSGVNGGEPLAPQTKAVEHEVHNPDGTTAVQHDVLHLDVNGNWVPESFSTKGADKALSGPSDMSHVGN
jgi:hypothetical protein